MTSTDTGTLLRAHRLFRLRLNHRRAAPVAVVLSALMLAACGGGQADAGQAGAGEGTPAAVAAPAAKEVQAPAARLVYTHDEGLAVLDAKTLKPVGTSELDGFNRLNPAGDGRHVLVSTGDSFRVFDAGSWTEAHGDHGHHFTQQPRLTGESFEASKAGHVVHHEGRTVLFNDGSGKVESFDPVDLSATEGADIPQTDVYTTPSPHHGVAVPLEGGKLLVTLGTEKGRTGVAVLDAGSGQERKELLRSEDCPGVHGEAVAADGAVAVGCENGMLIYRDGAITKVPSPDAYGRMGNQAGSESSPVILGDYKVDKAATLERPTRISLVNTQTGTLQLLDIGTSYSFRSLGRGPAGEALVLGTDGGLRVIDPVAGVVTSTIPVVAPWEESETWQDPRPTLFVQGSTAYVTEPATRKIHAVNMKSGSVVKSAQLEHVPNELTGVAG